MAWSASGADPRAGLARDPRAAPRPSTAPAGHVPLPGTEPAASRASLGQQEPHPSWIRPQPAETRVGGLRFAGGRAAPRRG